MRKRRTKGMDIKPIPDHKGYFASDCGKIFSTFSVSPFGFTGANMKERKPGNNGGYLVVRIFGETPKIAEVHHLVALAHIPNPNGSASVDHIDGDPMNNHVSNLRWGTHKEDAGYAKDVGLTEAQVDAIRNAKIEYGAGRDLATKYGVSGPTISMIRSRKRWKHEDRNK